MRFHRIQTFSFNSEETMNLRSWNKQAKQPFCSGSLTEWPKRQNHTFNIMHSSTTPPQTGTSATNTWENNTDWETKTLWKWNSIDYSRIIITIMMVQVYPGGFLVIQLHTEDLLRSVNSTHGMFMWTPSVTLIFITEHIQPSIIQVERFPKNVCE